MTNLNVTGCVFQLSRDIPNTETRSAIEEVKRLKADPHKKAYGSFKEIMKELPDE